MLIFANGGSGSTKEQRRSRKGAYKRGIDLENIFETDTAEGKGHNEAIDEKALCKKSRKKIMLNMNMEQFL